MAETNFVQVNPTVANQENDAAYQADSFVTGGAASGSVFDSITANKLFYQLSTMTAALAQMMKNKGYSLLDGTTPVIPSTFINLSQFNWVFDAPGAQFAILWLALGR
jgi:hypothetical protein